MFQGSDAHADLSRVVSNSFTVNVEVPISQVSMMQHATAWDLLCFSFVRVENERDVSKQVYMSRSCHPASPNLVILIVQTW